LALTVPDGSFIKVNPALCSMLGYPEKALLGRRLESIMTPDQWCRLSDLSREILAGKRNHAQIPLECRHRSGRTVRGLLNLSLVYRPGEGCPLFHHPDPEHQPA
jgi:PAS domain S-box-containing protein